MIFSKNTWIFLLTFLICNTWGEAQIKTDVSLYLKKDKNNYLTKISSKSGNLFNKLGHHGPAVENRWLAFRLYFNKKAAIDVYSKSKAGLELRAKKWYPNKKEQFLSWGGDYYKVANSIGLGGVKLWDGERIISLHPVSMRSARVVKGDEFSFMEMLSEGVPYRGEKVDVLVRLTVYNEKREAKVEAFSQTNASVQFVTGINYFKNLELMHGSYYVASWGIHPEDVSAEKVAVGAAILFNPIDFEKQLDINNQFLLISKPGTSMETWITSANAKEKNINSFEKFIQYINKL